MPVDSSEIDTAILAKLNGDAQLLALLPQGAHWDEAPPGSTRFVIVSLVDAVDEPQFGGRSYENDLYLVKAVALSTAITATNMRLAAARIDALLERGTLTPTGYSLMTMEREERIRLTEVDDVDPDIRWFHRGGRYRVVVST
jgi:hypothetical protein